MPILDLQRRLHEAGRIRIGRQVAITGGRNAGRTRPEKLDKFRFTSSSKRALDAVAALHGGTVEVWAGAPTGEQWELFTTASELPVIVPPEAMGFSQSYELWSAGGCARRCDGEVESISDGPCLCDAEARECKPHTRLSVMLVGVPGVGLWRLDTQGWYAAAELQGAHALAQLLAQSLGRSILPARLRVEARTVKRTDPKSKVITTRNFIVPILDFDVDVAAVALAGVPTLIEGGSRSASGITPIPALPAPSLADQLKEVDERQAPPARRNSPPALPRTGATPRPAAAVATPSTPEAPLFADDQVSGPPPSSEAGKGETPPQSVAMKRLHSMFRQVGVSDRADRMAVTSLILERAVETSRDLTDEELDQVSNRLVDVVEKRVRLTKTGDTWAIA